MNKNHLIKALAYFTCTWVFLWFLQGYYFVLNDVKYGGSGFLLFLLMAAEAVVCVLISIFAYNEIKKEK